MVEAVIETVGVHENPILYMNISQVLFSLRVLFLQENRIHAVGGRFQKGNNRVLAKGLLKEN